MKPRVHFVNRFYWPDQPATAQLLTELTRALVRRFEVSVVTAWTNSHSSAGTTLCAGVTVHRIRTTRWGRRSLIGRACDFATFHLAAGWRLLRLAQPGDIIVAMTDPPLLGLTAWCVARMRRARLLHWTQDIYPEVAVAVSGHRSLLALRPLRDFAWRHSGGCVVPGRQMADVICRAGLPDARVTVLPNWAPSDLRPVPATAIQAVRDSWGVAAQDFVVGYSGNLGRVHELLSLIEVAQSLASERRVFFVFVGDGPKRAALERATAARGLSNIRFFSAQPLSELAASLSAANVHLITLRVGCDDYVYPSKLYGVAAVGRPVIVIANPRSELARVVGAAGFGQSFAAHETGLIAQAILRLAREPETCHTLGRAAEAFARNGCAQAVETWGRLLAAEPVREPQSGVSSRS